MNQQQIADKYKISRAMVGLILQEKGGLSAKNAYLPIRK